MSLIRENEFSPPIHAPVKPEEEETQELFIGEYEDKN